MRNFPVIGIDDAGFNLHDRSWKITPVFGVIMKGDYIESICQTEIKIDDNKATEKIIEMIDHSGHLQNLDVLFHQGATIGGLGIIDTDKILQTLDLPVIIINRKKPEEGNLKSTMKNVLPKWEEFWDPISDLPEPRYTELIDSYLQCVGISFEIAVERVKSNLKRGYIPESLRIADMIGNSYYNQMINQ